MFISLSIEHTRAEVDADNAIVTESDALTKGEILLISWEPEEMTAETLINHLFYYWEYCRVQGGVPIRFNLYVSGQCVAMNFEAQELTVGEILSYTINVFPHWIQDVRGVTIKIKEFWPNLPNIVQE